MTDKLDGLNKWLNVDTWYTAHPSDDERFYKAVYTVLNANKGVYISGGEVSDYIEARYKGKLADDFLSDESIRAAVRFEAIREYLSTNKLL